MRPEIRLESGRVKRTWRVQSIIIAPTKQAKSRLIKVVDEVEVVDVDEDDGVDDDGKKKKAIEVPADDALTPKVIAKSVNLLLKNPTSMMRNASDHIPPQVAAFIQYVFKLFPFKFKGGANDIMPKDGRGTAAVQVQSYSSFIGNISLRAPGGNRFLNSSCW